MSALSAFTAIVIAFFAAIGDWLGDMGLGALVGLLVVIGFVIAAYNPPPK
jgi:hypothetical protein